MSTRAIIDIQDEDHRTFVSVYRHCDGYPEGLGQELRDIIRGVNLTNGFGFGDGLPRTFNGMGCFAAFLIGKLKDRIGNVYVVRAGEEGMDEEYRYTIRPTEKRKIQLITKEIR